MRKLFAVQCLLDRTKEEEPFDLVWVLSPDGGYVTEVKGLKVAIVGSEDSLVFLNISRGVDSCLIHEQRFIHISDSRFGKAVNSVSRKLGLGEAIKPPTDPMAQAESDLNKALNELIKRIHKQCFRRYQSDYQERVEEEIIHQLTGI